MANASENPATGGDRCVACGSEFECGMRAGREACWCAALPPLNEVHPGLSCLCPTCLEEKLREELRASQSSPAA